MSLMKRCHGGNVVKHDSSFNAPCFLQVPWSCCCKHLFCWDSPFFCLYGQLSREPAQVCLRKWHQCLAGSWSVGGRLQLDGCDSVTAGTRLPRARHSKSTHLVR